MSATLRFFFGGSERVVASGTVSNAPEAPADSDVALDGSAGVPLAPALDTGRSGVGNGALRFTGVGEGVTCVDVDVDP